MTESFLLVKPRKRMYLQRDGIDNNFPVTWNNQLWYSSKYNSGHGLDVIIAHKDCCSLRKKKRDDCELHLYFQAAL